MTVYFIAMTKIGLLSDTHCFFDERLFTFFDACDEIWHAGDIGNIETSDKISSFKPLRAVFGNVDGHVVRSAFPEQMIFNCEEMKVLMMHIGGYPNRYETLARREIIANKPDIFICGHSHILKVIFDKKYNVLHINPGAAGRGYQRIRTAIRFQIDKKNIKELEIIELEK